MTRIQELEERIALVKETKESMLRDAEEPVIIGSKMCPPPGLSHAFQSVSLHLAELQEELLFRRFLRKIGRAILATVIVTLVLGSVLLVVNLLSGKFYGEVAVFEAIGAPIFWKQVYDTI